jgi:hypothetical protein
MKDVMERERTPEETSAWLFRTSKVLLKGQINYISFSISLAITALFLTRNQIWKPNDHVTSKFLLRPFPIVRLY